mmetsp:Transcript_16776/g.37866  ORF Transcript_16776/g.37866 Transcript_16776/m.37866 type:complete len:167 (-) Transcript_16776:134-634(-)
MRPRWLLPAALLVLFPTLLPHCLVAAQDSEDDANADQSLHNLQESLEESEDDAFEEQLEEEDVDEYRGHPEGEEHGPLLDHPMGKDCLSKAEQLESEIGMFDEAHDSLTFRKLAHKMSEHMQELLGRKSDDFSDHFHAHLVKTKEKGTNFGAGDACTWALAHHGEL